MSENNTTAHEAAVPAAPAAVAGTPTEHHDPLPDFALKYAPLVYLHSEDEYFPGIPSEHVSNMIPRNFTGTPIAVPEDHRGKLSMLKLDVINKPDVFLTLEKDIRSDPRCPELLSSHCKPDAQGKSLSPVWIIVRDKTGVCDGEGPIVDVFYFFFYPYNQGNTVLFKHFGNHVGDWEHAMIRFRKSVPEAMHLSAHSDGNSWTWDKFEKKGDRPVIYSAGGSHAMYPTKGKHEYSGVFLVGPVDHTSAGYLWDPVQNFVCARSHHGEADSPCSHYTHMSSSHPGFNQTHSPDDVVTVLTYQGRWGNSFSDLRFRKPRSGSPSGSKIGSVFRKLKGKIDDSGTEVLAKAEEGAIKGEGPAEFEQLQRKGVHALSLYSKLLILIWAEGPTGPRDKSLERKTMNRWKEEILEALH
ncbi:hypothetical protein CPB86DRAFT_320176 [Serendipita vermifera]|nr:hypothetical protein CPB86DRAFT_320176 [Serendipita vermifera]